MVPDGDGCRVATRNDGAPSVHRVGCASASNSPCLKFGRLNETSIATPRKCMSTQQGIRVIEGLYALFQRGDVPGIVAQLTDDIRWVSHMESNVPWSGDFSGKHRVPQFFKAMFEALEVEAFVPREWVAQGDTVVSIGEFACRVRSTGKTSRTRWAFVWTLRDGKVCSYEQFHGPELAAAFR